MKTFKKIFIFTFVLVWLTMEAGALVAQERYSTLRGVVRGVHVHVLRKWLEVESDKEKAIVNFRIGRDTVYIPRRHPIAGERVKVEYFTRKGVPVAYRVTFLEGQK